MNKIFFILLVLTSFLIAQNPGKCWEKYSNPVQVGWNLDSISIAKKYYDQLGSDALMVIYKGKVLVDWGNIHRRYMLHSARKTLLSALLGVHVDRGEINLDKSLIELEIDDIYPLSNEEKQATISDMLKARSGVYHPAAYEAPRMEKLRPERGSYEHNTHWYYNNWDFNTLCTILEQEISKDIFEDFNDELAIPLEMEDFRLIDGYHHYELEKSNHPAYPFKMSARDMARIGLLFCNGGIWNNEQIISNQWIKESSTSYSATAHYGPFGYGYLWWVQDSLVNDTKLYSAMGVGIQTISVMPEEDLVFVHRVNTYDGNKVKIMDILELYEKILNGKVESNLAKPEVILLDEYSSWYSDEIINITEKELFEYIGNYTFWGRPAKVERSQDFIFLKTELLGNFRLLPIEVNTFLIEDMEKYIMFHKNMEGKYAYLTYHETKNSMNIFKEILNGNVKETISDYESLIVKYMSKMYNEDGVNNLGYQLLGLKRIDEAIKVFELNVSLYPDSYNVYDSLGEAYMHKDDTKNAIRNYEKSLELNPQNENARDMLLQLK